MEVSIETVAKLKTYIINPKAIVKKQKGNETNKPRVEIKMNYEKYPTDPKESRKKKNGNKDQKRQTEEQNAKFKPSHGTT